MNTDHFVALAKFFVYDFYFQCVTTRTSKKIAEDIKKAAKEAECSKKEAQFQPNEQSIKDIVIHEVQKEVSKFQNCLKQTVLLQTHRSQKL